LALLVCKSCTKAFLSGPQEEFFCLDCAARLRELYPLVRNFLRNHYEETYTAQSLSKTMGIALKDVNSLILMGLLGHQADDRAALGSKIGGRL